MRPSLRGSASYRRYAHALLETRRFTTILAMTLLLVSVLPASTRADDTSTIYRFGPGDRVRINVLDSPELSGEFTVQQWGGISLPSVGRIQVVGRSFDEFENEVMKRLRESALVAPQVSVEVAEYRPVYVVGDVHTPGQYPFKMGMTVLQALAMAGGFLTLDEETIDTRLQVLQAQEAMDTLEVDYLAAIAKRARLLAERDNIEKIQFPPEIVERQADQQVADLVDGETRLFATRRAALEGGIAILENQIGRLNEETTNLEAQLKAVERRSELVETELRDVEYLFGKGLTAKTRMLDLQRVQTEVQSDRLGIAAFMARARQEIGRVELSMAALRNDRLDQILGDLAAVQLVIAELEVRRHSGKELLAMRQAMSVQPAVKLVLSDESFVITRDQGNGPEDIEATDRSYVLPGDVVRISKFELLPAAPAN